MTGQDRTLISLTEDNEVRDWCKSLNTTPEKLQDAVKAVGNCIAALPYVQTRCELAKHFFNVLANAVK